MNQFRVGCNNTSPLQIGIPSIFCAVKEKPRLRGKNVPSVYNGVTYTPKLSPSALHTKGHSKQVNRLNRLSNWVDLPYKNIYFCFIDYVKTFECVDHNKLWKILKEMGIPDHLTCLLRNLYAGQEATVRTGHCTKDWFQIGKGVCQG